MTDSVDHTREKGGARALPERSYELSTLDGVGEVAEVRCYRVARLSDSLRALADDLDADDDLVLIGAWNLDVGDGDAYLQVVLTHLEDVR